MKARRWVVGGVLAVVATAAAPVADDARPASAAAGLIEQLADDSFAVRERATRELWGRGEAVMPELKRALLSEDPEVAYRARELIDKIDLGILPDTSPEIQELVRSYQAADERMKSPIVFRLGRQRAWRQILKLYEREASARVREELRSNATAASLAGAREAIVAGDDGEALEYLELAPHDAEGLAAWAAYHVSCGTAEAELEQARGLAGVTGALRRMALLRAAGDLGGASAEAEAAGEPAVAAALRLLAGDPLPWLQLPVVDENRTVFHEGYIRWVVERWKGGGNDRPLIDGMLRVYEEVAEEDRWPAVGALYLAGEAEAADRRLEAFYPDYAFLHYEASERVDDSLRVFGLDPGQPDFAGWAAERIRRIVGQPDDSEADGDQLFMLCAVLEARGQAGEVAAVLEPFLDQLAADDAERFLEVLGELFVRDVKRAAVAAAERYAGVDGARWMQVAGEVSNGVPGFGGEEGLAVWSWIEGQANDRPGAERLRALMAVFGLLPGEEALRTEWLARVRQAADGAEGAERERLLMMLLNLARTGWELDLALHAARSLAKGDPKHPLFRFYLLLLSAAGEWAEAAEAWRLRVEQYPASPESQAFLAASLRAAGRAQEAAASEQLAARMALADGSACLGIGRAYAYSGDFDRAAAWWRRAMVESVPGSDAWREALESLRTAALEQRDWGLAAALGEAYALEWLRGSNVSRLPTPKLRARFDADFARAMSMLERDRAGALALVERCHRMLPVDGSLADHFLPALRDAGLLAEHDRYFEHAWQALAAMTQRFPDSDNSHNTAAWLAARANRRLDEAAAHLERALAAKPHQSAYLDTMAELWFARGDRDRAVEWSRQAVGADPEDEMLRRQLARFRTAAFPQG